MHLLVTTSAPRKSKYLIEVRQCVIDLKHVKNSYEINERPQIPVILQKLTQLFQFYNLAWFMNVTVNACTWKK